MQKSSGVGCPKARAVISWTEYAAATHGWEDHDKSLTKKVRASKRESLATDGESLTYLAEAVFPTEMAWPLQDDHYLLRIEPPLLERRHGSKSQKHSRL
jgi:hypothetical protein